MAELADATDLKSGELNAREGSIPSPGTIKMTEAELAREKLKYWKLISRARRIGFEVPKHWLKYGDVPKDRTEIFRACLDAYFNPIRDPRSYNYLYKYLRK